MVTKKKYDAQSINWLKGAEGIRANIAYYLGTVGNAALLQMPIEIIGNSGDEAASGYGDTIIVKVDKDNTVTIWDFGRGVPVDKNPEFPEYDSVLSMVFMELHTSGKKNNQDGYESGTIGCFTGDTKISLFGNDITASDSSISFEELYNNWENGYNKPFDVFSYNINAKISEIKRCYHVQLSKYVTKLAYVHLDNGECIKCTVDHPFLNEDNIYEQAQFLKPGTKLKSLNGTKTVSKLDIFNFDDISIPVYGMSVQDNNNYLLDAGVFVSNTHGVGCTVVNAISEYTKVWSFAKNGSVPHAQFYEKGVPTTDIIRDKNYPKAPYMKQRPGTIVQFKPDLSCFQKGSKLIYNDLLNWIRDLSWFVYHNKRNRAGKVVQRKHVRFICIGPDGKALKVQRTGLEKYYDTVLNSLGDKVEAVGIDEPYVLNSESLDISLGWSSSTEEHIKSYVNGVYNSQGGTHLKTFQKCIYTIFKQIARKNQKFKQQDLFVGAIGCINLRIKAPKFDGQSKSHLVSEEAVKIVEDEFMFEFAKWCKRNIKVVRELIERACEINKLSDNLKKDKRLAAALKTKQRGKLIYPAKMVVSHTKDASKRELYIVEGDSAKGSAAAGSNREYQEILPLRGKVLNVLRESKSKTGNETSQAIIDILIATGINPTDGIEKMRVGSIMLMMDSDADGAHISSLVISTLYKYAPELFDEGKVYYVDTPLYVHQSNSGNKTYAKSFSDLKAKVGDKINSGTITRAKGLGELNADVLADVAFNPETRIVKVLDAEVVRNKIRLIMGDDPTQRKQMLGIS